MKYKRIDVSKNRFIDIYDDVFDFAEVSKMAMYVKRSAFKLERVPSVDLPDYLKFATLKSEYNIYELLSMGFILSPNLKFLRDRIRENDLRLHRVYVNLSTAQDIYTYHVDGEYHTEPTVLYYVNPIWDPLWEGETHFSDEDGKDIIFSSSFMPNRVVYFSSTIPHKSSQPSFLAKDFRYTLTLKFSSKRTQKHKEDFPIADFFLDRDLEISDVEKNAIEFIRSRSESIPHSGTTLFNHLYNTFVILKQHGCKSSLCLAGLCHSIYGTEFYERLRITDRRVLQEIIGTEAEDIVYRFCNLGDRDAELLNPACFDKDLVHIAYANLIEEKFRDQCHESEIISYKNKLIEIEG